MQSYSYNAKYKPNQLICGNGRIAIVTGWTPVKTVANKLHRDDYAVVGQLYSPTRGISFLIRNLLLNPHVRYLIVLNATKEDKNAGGCDCLIDFFDSGVKESVTENGRKCWEIRSPILGYIDGEISKEAVETIYHRILYYEASSIDGIIELINMIKKEEAGLGEKSAWGEPMEFPVIESAPTILPGPRYAHRIEGKTIAEVWVKIIQRIKSTGTIRPTGYDGKWQELIDLVAVVTDEPEGMYFPEPNYLPTNEAEFKEYIPQILNDKEKQEGVKYSYGQRLRSWFGRDQIEQVINKLVGEIDAASAVMSLWDVLDHEKGGSPCLNHIWLRVVDNELSLTATFRSNDMFSAWPSNAMGLRALQQHIKEQIEARSEYRLKMGPLITVSQSAHIYDDCWANADSLIEKQYATICNQRNYDDPTGNFIIEVIDGTSITVTHTTPGSGEKVGYFVNKKALPLIREIAACCPAIQPEHIGYLGAELQKAEICIKTGQTFVQDR